MNDNIPPMPADAFWKSKKLLALALGVIAIIALVVVAVIWAVDKTIVIGAFSSVTSLVGIHLGGQSAVDRAQAYSPNYVPPTRSPDVRVP